MKLKRIYLFIWLLTSGTSCYAEPIIHITTEHWPPNNYQALDGKIVGKAVDKVKQMFAVAGLEYKLSIYPWARAYHLAKTEENTGVFSIMKSYKREKLFQWVCPLLTQDTLYVAKLTQRTDIKIKTLADIKNYNIAVSRNEFDHQYLIQNGFNEEHFQITTGDLVSIKLFINGRTDLLIGSEYTLRHSMKLLGQKAQDITMVLPLNTSETNPLCLAFGHNTPTTVVDKLRRALVQINSAQN